VLLSSHHNGIATAGGVSSSSGDWGGQSVRRRDIVAGVASLGAFASGVALFQIGVPSIDGENRDEAASGADSPVSVETIDARGSTDGAASVPADGVTILTFFVTGCGQCQTQIPKLAVAHEKLTDEYGAAVHFLSVTYQSIDRLPPDELRDWWEHHEGNWAVGYDPDSTLAARYGIVGYPVTTVIDADGESQFQETGVTQPDQIVEAVESALDR